jgi:hypothetical protein
LYTWVTANRHEEELDGFMILALVLAQIRPNFKSRHVYGDYRMMTSWIVGAPALLHAHPPTLMWCKRPKLNSQDDSAAHLEAKNLLHTF